MADVAVAADTTLGDAARADTTRIHVTHDEVLGTTRAMTTGITVRVVHHGEPSSAVRAVTDALQVFSEVQAACTRLDPDSPLMRANARPRRWHEVPRVCRDVLLAAHEAYTRTSGRFDPRVLDDLVRLGYPRSADAGPQDGRVATLTARVERGRWRPRFRRDPPRVFLGGVPVDLGGIGKALAVRWAAERLRAWGPDHLVEAGRDCSCSGLCAGSTPWRVAVEDPRGGGQPIAVLGVLDAGCATASVRSPRGRAGGDEVLPLPDPRDGRSGRTGLLAVTVIHPDPAWAEVWSETLFLAGHDSVADLAARERLTALWMAETGELGLSGPMRGHLLWTAW